MHGREGWTRFEMYSPTERLAGMRGICAREKEGEREESLPSVYILRDSLTHGGSSMKGRDGNH